MFNIILEVKNGTFCYSKDKFILNRVNFGLEAGEIIAIMGKNGIGKTTLLKCIVGILKWTEGDSEVDNEKTDFKTLRRIGYVPQAHKTSFSYTVFEMVLFGRIGHHSYFAVPKEEDYKEVEKVLKHLEISDLSDKPCNELSGGQLQLVFIARALVHSPKLLILDEPEAHLDFRNQLKLMKVIKEYVVENNIACIINTHYPNYAILFADKCLLLGDNRYMVGKTEDIMNEKNIAEYFSVFSKKISASHNGKDIPAFVFIEEISDKTF